MQSSILNLKKNGFAPCANDEKWDSVFKAHDSSWDILADVLKTTINCPSRKRFGANYSMKLEVKTEELQKQTTIHWYTYVWWSVCRHIY